MRSRTDFSAELDRSRGLNRPNRVGRLSWVGWVNWVGWFWVVLRLTGRVEIMKSNSPFIPLARNEGAVVVCARWCPALPRPVGRSTMGAGVLSFRVRDGSGRVLPAMTTETFVWGVWCANPPGGCYRSTHWWGCPPGHGWWWWVVVSVGCLCVVVVCGCCCGVWLLLWWCVWVGWSWAV